MTDTIQKLREALRELIEAYSRAGPGLSRAERAVDRMRLIAAHEALALPTADHIPDAGEMVADHLPDAGKMINGLTQAETDASASVSGLTAAPVGDRDLPPVIAYRLDYPASEGVGLPRFFGADDGERAHTFAFNHKATITELCDRAAMSAGDAVDAQRWKTSELISRAALTPPDKRTEQMNIAFNAYRKAMKSGQSYAACVDAAIDAAMRKGQL